MRKRDFAAILDALDEPVILLDHESVIVGANLAADELLGGPLPDVPLVRVLRQPQVLACVEDVLFGTNKSTANVRHVGGENQTYRITAVALDGSDAAVALTLRDVTPILQAAQQRSDFVANVSHELRSPLTTLSGIIETLQGPASQDPAAQQRFLAVMESEAGRMNRLIDDLLSLSRVEEHERVRPTETVDLLKVIRMTVDLVRGRERGGGTIEVVSDVEEAFVTGDGDQLQQVFLNLTENALRYGSEDITIQVEHRASAPRFPGEVWAITVADKGEGIAAEHIPRLTERFYRVDSGRSRAKGGTGLGLAICKHIVNRHRGRLDVTSKIGEGTTVHVLLPAEEG